MIRRFAALVLPSLVILASCGGSDAGPSPSSASSGSAGSTSGGPRPSVDGGPSTNDASGGGAVWSSRASLPFAQQETAVLAVDSRVYVLGGFDASGAVLNVVHVYDPKTNAWSTAAPLPKPLHHINAAVVGAQIWIVGALLDRNFVQTGDIIAFDPKTNQWTPKGSMPVGSERGASFTAAIGDTIFVAGGLRGGAPVTTFSSYNTTSGTWNTTLPPMPTARDHGGGAAVAGTSFLAVSGRGGGINSHTTRVDAFDVAAGVWTDKSAPIPTSRGGFALATLEDGRVVVMGGEGDSRNPATGVFPEVEIYDPKTNTWSALTAMKTPRHGMGAAAIGNTIYVPGGGSRQAFAATDVVEALSFE